MSKHIHIHTAALLRPKVKAKDSKFYLVGITGNNLTAHTAVPFFNSKAEAESYKKKFKHVAAIKNAKIVEGESTSTSFVRYNDAQTPYFGTPEQAKREIDGIAYDCKAKDAGEITYFKGNKASYTGKKEELYGRTAYEIKLLEGPEKGKTKVTYREPGKIGPANLDAKDESAEAKARHEGALNEKETAMASEHVEHREDTPASVFLMPAARKYPVKTKQDGEYKYDRGLLLAAAREARMHGHGALADRADAIREREFGAKDASLEDMISRGNQKLWEAFVRWARENGRDINSRRVRAEFTKTEQFRQLTKDAANLPGRSNHATS